jgi:translation initiation factor 2 beta subunit (eIF-2beta)/eIF-5
MQKITLQFFSLTELAQFAKTLDSGYLINTSRLCLTGMFSNSQIVKAIKMFNGRQIKTTEKVFTYN